MSSPERPASLDQTSLIDHDLVPAADVAPVDAVSVDAVPGVAVQADAVPGVDAVHTPDAVDAPAGAQQDDVAQSAEAVTEPPASPTIWEQMGGPMGMLDSGLPVVVFVIVNAISSLGWAVGAALAAGVIIAITRLARRKPVTQAIAGLFGVGIAAFIAYRTGSAKGYFLFGIWSFVVYGSALLLSIIARWPLVGVLWESVNGRGTSWRRDRKLVRRYDYATAVWVVVFAARFAVQNQLYAADKVGWLATARLLMGYPVYLLAIVATVLIVGSANGMSLPSMRTVFGRKRTAEPVGSADTGSSRPDSSRADS